MAKSLLSGTIEIITFRNEESGYSVIKILGEKKKKFSVLGVAPVCEVGESLTAEGEWENHPKFGATFKADSIRTSPPTSLEGIEKFLASGLIQGIGKVYAKKIVEKFKDKTLEIIEKESKRLQEIEGIGEERRKSIKESWKEQKEIRELMVFLHSIGVSTNKALKVHKLWGEAAREKISKNPYVLAQFVDGIGFKTADGIGEKVGLARESLERIQAGIEYTLLEGSTQGHTGLPEPLLLQTCSTLLGIDEVLIKPGILALAEAKRIKPMVFDTGEEGWGIYYLEHAEVMIGKGIERILIGKSTYPPIISDKALEWVCEKIGKSLAPSQTKAVEMALSSKFLIITGGPGVGKTTILQAIVRILEAKRVRIKLCAPTGRAAKRLSESTGREAMTIHRMIELGPTGKAGKNSGTPLELDTLICDETSMVDVVLFSKLLDALPSESHIVLVGDVDQLPSVGPGAVLKSLIECGRIPVVYLTEIFRQAKGSQIVEFAHQINHCQMPDLSEVRHGISWKEEGEPEKVVEWISAQLDRYSPKELALNFMILTPMHKGLVGTANLNQVVQKWAQRKRGTPFIACMGTNFHVGDRVIQTENNYDKEVFNGDVGIITRVSTEESSMTVDFEGRLVDYLRKDLNQISLAYAISIHKSQGSEFKSVLIPVTTQHYIMLDKRLIYTAITRGKEEVLLVGQKKALAIAVNKSEMKERFTGIRTRLRAGKLDVLRA